MKLDKYLITLALETLLEQVRDAGEEFEVINRVIKEAPNEIVKGITVKRRIVKRRIEIIGLKF